MSWRHSLQPPLREALRMLCLGLDKRIPADEKSFLRHAIVLHVSVVVLSADGVEALVAACLPRTTSRVQICCSFWRACGAMFHCACGQ